jgi:hypothetical protein
MMTKRKGYERNRSKEDNVVYGGSGPPNQNGGLVGKMRGKSSTLQSGDSAEDRTKRTLFASTFPVRIVSSSTMVTSAFLFRGFTDTMAIGGSRPASNRAMCWEQRTRLRVPMAQIHQWRIQMRMRSPLACGFFLTMNKREHTD